MANNIHLYYLPCYVWLLTFIYCRSDKNKALDLGITLFVTFSILQIVVGQCSYEVLQLFAYNLSLDAIKKYNTCRVIIAFLFGIGMAGTLSYIAYHIFLKTKKYKWWFIVPILQFASVIIMVLSQSALTQLFFVISNCLEMSVIVILIIFLQGYLENKNSIESVEAQEIKIID